MRTMIHSANAKYDKKRGEIVKKADFLVPVLNWIITKHYKNDNDNDDDDYYYYYDDDDDDDDDRWVYG